MKRPHQNAHRVFSRKLNSPAQIALVCLLLAGHSFAGDKTVFRYAFPNNAPLRYQAHSQIETSQEIMGSAMQTQAILDAVTRLTPVGVKKDGALTFILNNESFQAKITSPQVDSTLKNPDGLVGKRVQKTIAANGDQIASRELDTFTVPQLLPGYATDQEFLVNLPEAALAVGESAEVADVDTTHSFGGENISHTTITYTLVGAERLDGRHCLRLEVKGQLALEGSGAFRGTPYFLEGDGSVEGNIWFAPDEGLLVRTQNSVALEMTIAFSGQQSFTIPTTQRIEMTLELAK